MSRFADRIRPHVARELDRSREAERRGDLEVAFRHLERAHVLGQASTREHLRAHWAMLGWGIRCRSFHEVAGQILRLIGAATKTVFGLIPAGNTGGSSVSPFRRLPVPNELQAIIDEACAD